jgi:hypothetical protein
LSRRAHQRVAQAILDSVDAPGAGRDGFIAACQAAITRADEDLKHALRWGWTPGSTGRRHLFGPVVPYAGLAWWLDHGSAVYASHCQGVSKKPYTSSEATKVITRAHERLSREARGAPALFSPSEGNY